MSAASSVCCACSASPGDGFGPQARRQLRQLERRDGAHLAVGRAGGQPHHAIHQHALLGAADLGFVGRGRRRVEGGLGQAVDDFLQARQRRVHGVLRHHARGAVELQHEADGHVRRHGGRAERIESIAGGAREQFAMAAEARRARRNGVEHLLGHGQLGGLQACWPAPPAPCADWRPSPTSRACGRRRACRRCNRCPATMDAADSTE